jgi:hypothetical protein
VHLLCSLLLGNRCGSFTNFRFTESGALLHIASNKCLHPLNSLVPEDTPLVLRSNCEQLLRTFEVTAEGSLRHVASGR